MKRYSSQLYLLAAILMLISLGENIHSQSRVKDVAHIHGARENQLVGYGLVIGLDGQGDSDSDMIRQTVSNMVKRFGITVNASSIKAKNAAVVMVTAQVPPFVRTGMKLDVSVSSLSDAKSLQGGTLLQTPLLGADGNVYAVGQGSVSVGGFSAGGGGGGNSVQKNHPTAGRLPGGALVEREIPTTIFPNGALEVVLRDSDFTSAVRLANAINSEMGDIAQAMNGSTVKVYVPKKMQNPAKRMEFVARVENVKFRPDVPARIVINEKTGTIVANAKIRIHRVAVAHGNLRISIKNTLKVSQPNPFTGNVVGDNTAGAGGAGGAGGSGGTAAAGMAGAAETPLIIGANAVFENASGQQLQVPIGTTPPAGYSLVMVPSTGQPPAEAPGATGAAGGDGGNVINNTGTNTVVTNDQTTEVEEEKANIIVLDELPTVEEVAAALNSLGVTPRDMMSIFQAMKQAGALQAELIMQ